MKNPPKEFDIERAKEIAICYDDLDIQDWDDIVALAFQQVFDFIVSHCDSIDSEYLTENYYVYGNYLDSRITYNELDIVRLEQVEICNKEARDLFEEYFNF